MEHSLGDVSAGLLRELKQAQGTSSLPPYNDAKVKKVIQEIQWLWHQNNELIRVAREEGADMQDATKITLYVNHTAIHRNKRCLLAYLQHRIQATRETCWAAGMTIPPEIRSDLSPAEQNHMEGYLKLVSQYSRAVGVNLAEDLSPPKDLYIEVEPMQDLDDIETSRGPIKMRKNTRQFLLRADAENLIRRGLVAHVTTNERH